MIDKTQDDFENYLDGNSDLSQLYAKSRNSQAPDNLAVTITEAAHKNPSAARLSAGNKATNKMVLP